MPSGRKMQYLVMPMGLLDSTNTLERILGDCLASLNRSKLAIYLDDIITFADTQVELLDNLRQILTRLRGIGLKVKSKKCVINRKEIVYLGNVLSEDGCRPNPELVEVVEKWMPPKNVKQIMSYLGRTGYYRRYIKGYSAIAAPLTSLLRKGEPFVWGKEQQQAFETLKVKLTTKPLLAHVTQILKDVLFILEVDVCDFSIGAVLTIREDAEERPVAYGSQKLSQSHKNMCAT